MVPRNDADALAKALIEILTNVALAKKYAEAAEISARTYSADLVLNKWDSFIEMVSMK